MAAFACAERFCRRLGLPHGPAARFCGCTNAARNSPGWHGVLLFWEQIQGPENAPIARFSGLGCYQSRSETGRRIGGGLRRARSGWGQALALLARIGVNFIDQVRHVLGRRVLADAVAEVEDVAHAPAFVLP